MATKRILIVDNYGTPLPGANVVTGPGQGSITDFDGYATVNVGNTNQQVQISYVGFKTQTIGFSNLPQKVVLQESIESLAPVVITAPKKKETDWAKWLGVGIGAIGLLAALSGNDEPQEVIPVKAKKVTL